MSFPAVRLSPPVFGVAIGRGLLAKQRGPDVSDPA
jgi:hypothetical protein